jgi:hypothetical protein
MSSRIIISNRITRCGIVALLLCIYLASLHLSYAQNNSRVSDEVFCPLQKTWVKKAFAPSPTEKQRESLKEICAGDERKTDFLSQLTESLRLTKARPDDEETRRLFFSYFAEGRSALAQYISSRNVPEPQYIDAISTEKSANGSKFQFIASGTSRPSLAVQPRVSDASEKNNFVSRSAAELKNISRRIKARAPPFFI